MRFVSGLMNELGRELNAGQQVLHEGSATFRLICVVAKASTNLGPAPGLMEELLCGS